MSLTMENIPLKDLETWEILDYLRVQRFQHVLVNFNKDMYATELNIYFSDENWKDFLMYCDGVDNQAMFSRAEKYINQWKGNCLLNDFLDKE